MFERFAPDEEMRIYNRGIRRRLAPMLSGDRQRLEMAYSLLFSLPGTPVIVYGDEIGMGENLSLPQRNAVRTPMQWSSERNGGFSTADESKLFRAAVTEGPFGFEQLNVAAQQADKDSLLNWFKRLVQVRRQTHEVGWGSYHLLNLDHSSLFVHGCEFRSQRMVAVHNLSGQPADTVISLSHCHKLTPMFGQADVEPHGRRGSALAVQLSAHSAPLERAGH